MTEIYESKSAELRRELLAGICANPELCMTLLSETVSSEFINRSGGVYVTCFCLRSAKNRRTQRGLFTLCKKQAKKHYEQGLLHFKDHAHNSNNQPDCCKQPKRAFSIPLIGM